MVVGDDAVAPGVGAGVLRRGGNEVRIGVSDLTEPGPLADVDQFATRADDDHTGTRADDHAVTTDCREQRDLLWAQRHSCGDCPGPGWQVFPFSPDALAAPNRATDRHTGYAPVGVLERDHGVCSGGYRRAGHD